VKILVSGSRDWNYYGAFKKAMIDVLSELQYKLYFRKAEVEIIQGGAWGVDYMARKFAKESRYTLKDFPANWDNLNPEVEKVSVGQIKNNGHTFNKLAGVNRNLKMMDYINPHNKKVLISFQMDKSKGAQSMIDICLKASIPIYHFQISSIRETELKLSTYNVESQWVQRYR